MQNNPLLVQLDLCFTSINWTSTYPNTLLLPLAKTTLDHIPSSIPKANIFQFENYWIEHPGFIDVVTIARNKEKLF
jgi:hypothetical protein